MAQFDVYKNPDPQTSKEIPYLVDVQHELLDELATRVVIPLLTRAAMPRPAQTLNPEFKIEGRGVVLSTAELAGVPLYTLGDRVGSLTEHRDAIIRAMDMILAGL